ncbi:unnamed protein product [Phytophthora lilii]|uniref:Unnamed protein product n=1 Tax=Phytophthora lilii TaxID=2077276 RepID=A0A9W6TJ36_9STRA|nr:unnamed protein product [Phytophthora lilii]
MTIDGRGRDAYVLVVKQAGAFTHKSQDLHRFKAEIYQLNSLLSGDSSTTNRETGVDSSESATNVTASMVNMATRTNNSSSPTTSGTKRPRDEPEIIVIE